MSVCSYSKKLDPVEKRYREILAKFNEYILNDTITAKERYLLAQRVEAFQFEAFDKGFKDIGNKLGAMWKHLAEGGLDGHAPQ